MRPLRGYTQSQCCLTRICLCSAVTFAADSVSIDGSRAFASGGLFHHRPCFGICDALASSHHQPKRCTLQVHFRVRTNSIKAQLRCQGVRSLFGCRVGDKGIEYLTYAVTNRAALGEACVGKDLRQLRYLNLHGTQLTDAAAKLICQWLPQLVYVSLSE